MYWGVKVNIQKQPSRGVLRKICSENMRQIYRRTPVIKWTFKSCPPEVFLGKYVLKICGKFTGGHPSWKAISIKLLCNFIAIALRHRCSPVNLLHILPNTFYKNTSEGLLLSILKITISLPKSCEYTFSQQTK